MDTRHAYIALNLLPGIGPARVRALLEITGSPQAILSASASELMAAKGVGREIASLISGWRENIDLDAEL